MPDCPQCGLSFSRPFTLNRHKRHVHLAFPAQATRYTCSECNETFSRRENLERHRKAHAGEDLEHCEHCNRGFNRGYLRVHLQTCRMRMHRDLSTDRTPNSGPLPNIRWKEPVTIEQMGETSSQPQRTTLHFIRVAAFPSVPPRPRKRKRVASVRETSPPSPTEVGSEEEKDSDLDDASILILVKDAIEDGDLSELKRLVESPLAPHCAVVPFDEIYQDARGFSLLQLAVVHRRFDFVEYFISEGVDVDFLDKNGKTALHQASEAGYTAVIELLLDSGADTDAGLDREPPLAALSCAGASNQVDAVELLLKRGASQDVHDDDRCSLLESSIQAGHEEIADMLLLYGATVDPDDDGCSPLHFAAAFGSIDMITKLLSKGAQIDSGVVDDNATALAFAAQQGRKDVTELLLKHGADVNGIKGSWGTTPLMEACTPGRKTSEETICSTLDFMIQKRAYVNLCRPLKKGGEAKTALSLAVRHGKPAVVDTLLEARADPNLGTSPPLEYLLGLGEPENIEMMEILLKAGARPDLCAEEVIKPLMSKVWGLHLDPTATAKWRLLQKYDLAWTVNYSVREEARRIGNFVGRAKGSNQSGNPQV